MRTCTPFRPLPAPAPPEQALLLVGITFYACLALGAPLAVAAGEASDTTRRAVQAELEGSWRRSRWLGLAAILCLTLPFTLFLWWLALARTWVRPLVSACARERVCGRGTWRGGGVRVKI
jgi:hypothetical protein